MTPRHVTVPEHVSAVDLGPATVLLDYRTGAVQVLTGPSARWWAELAETGDTASPTALAASSARALVGQLHAAGLLVFAERPRPWSAPVAGRPLLPSWGTQEVQAGRAPIPRVPYRVLPVAAVALAAVLAVAHVGQARARMARLTRLLRWAARLTVGPAPAERARQAVYAVRRVGLLCPAAFKVGTCGWVCGVEGEHGLVFGGRWLPVMVFGGRVSTSVKAAALPLSLAGVREGRA